LIGGEVFTEGRIKFAGYKVDSMQTTNRVKIVYDEPEKYFSPGDSVNVSLTLNNPSDYIIDFNHSQFQVQLCVVIIKGEETYIQPAVLSEPIDILHKGEILHRKLKATIPDLPSGNYQFGISLNTRLGPTLNSIFVKIKIEDHD